MRHVDNGNDYIPGRRVALFFKARQKVLASRSRIVRKFWRMRALSVLRYYGAYVPISEKIKPMILPHGFYGIFISLGATIGDNCTVFQQVTVGSNTFADSKNFGTPVIGDNVYIGAGAKIIGGVTIGNNVRIGANCVVTQDIPDNSTVVGQKPRVITRESAPDNSFGRYNPSQPT